MRVVLVFLALLIIPIVAVYFFSQGRKAELQQVIEANVTDFNTKLSGLKEGVTFTYDRIEIEGFFTLPDATFINPRLALTMSGRKMTLAAESMTLSPESSEYSTFRVSVPPVMQAIDSFQGKDFTYEVRPHPIPRLTLRTPKDELMEQKDIQNPSLKRYYNGTKPEELKELPTDIIHQFSVNWPANLNISVNYGPRAALLHYKFQPMPFGRAWQRTHYYLKGNILWFFGQVTKAIMDAPPPTAPAAPIQ